MNIAERIAARKSLGMTAAQYNSYLEEKERREKREQAIAIQREIVAACGSNAYINSKGLATLR